MVSSRERAGCGIILAFFSPLCYPLYTYTSTLCVPIQYLVHSQLSPNSLDDDYHRYNSPLHLAPHLSPLDPTSGVLADFGRKAGLQRQRTGGTTPHAGFTVEDDLVRLRVRLGEPEPLLELVRGQEEAVGAA